MLNSKVSVIIPFYNAEKYIKRCVKSILCQTYENIELLLVNNMSSDSSLKIVEELAENDSRVKIIECYQQGVSFARNYGIERATGEYVLFVDADDYLNDDAIERLVGYRGYYSVEMGFCNEDESGNIISHSISTDKESIFGKKQMMEGLFTYELGHYRVYIWNKLLVRKVITDNNILFNTDIKYNEDRLFLFSYFEAIPDNGQVMYIPYEGYYYVDNSQSAMNTLEDRPMSVILTEIKAFVEMMKQSDDEDVDKRIIHESVRCTLLILRRYNINIESEEFNYILNYMDMTGKIFSEELHCQVVRTCINYIKKYSPDKKSKEYIFLKHLLKKHIPENRKYRVLRFVFLHPWLVNIYIRIK